MCLNKVGGYGCLGRKVRGDARHYAEETENSQKVIYGWFATTTDVLGTPPYMGRPRTLLTGPQCSKQGSRAIFGIFGPPPANFGSKYN